MCPKAVVPDVLTSAAAVSRQLDGETAGVGLRDPKISLVIPAKNEARNLPWVLSRVPALVDEVVLVDGLSRDETVAVARMVRSDVIVIHEDRPGKGIALRSGFDAASGDYLVMMDADCSMDPQEISRYIEALDAGADLVKGSRFCDGGGTRDMGWLRRAGNRSLLTLANLIYGTHHSDLCYGFMAIRRDALERLQLDADGFEIEMQLIARGSRAGLRVLEVPSFEAKRQFGESNLRTFRDGWRVLRTLLREAFRAGPRTAETPPELRDVRLD